MRVANKVLILLVMLFSIAIPAHFSVAHAQSIAPKIQCGSEYWKTIDTNGWVPDGAGGQFTASMEALTSVQYGTFCGYIRSKGTFARPASECDSILWTALEDNYGRNFNSVQVGWSGCGGSEYALFGPEYFVSSYSNCPFLGDANNLYSQAAEDTGTGHCTL